MSGATKPVRHTRSEKNRRGVLAHARILFEQGNPDGILLEGEGVSSTITSGNGWFEVTIGENVTNLVAFAQSEAPGPTQVICRPIMVRGQRELRFETTDQSTGNQLAVGEDGALISLVVLRQL